MVKALLAAAVLAALGWLGLCWYLHANQRGMVYYGWATTADAAGTDIALARPGAMLRGWLVNPGKPDPILYFGGNAERIEGNRLALITPFDSLVGTARAHYPLVPVDWLMTERYDSAAALKAYRRPVLVLHAGLDTVVPEACTARLIAALPVAPRVLRFPAAGHDDIAGHAAYAAALSDFLQRPAPAQAPTPPDTPAR